MRYEIHEANLPGEIIQLQGLNDLPGVTKETFGFELKDFWEWVLASKRLYGRNLLVLYVTESDETTTKVVGALVGLNSASAVCKAGTVLYYASQAPQKINDQMVKRAIDYAKDLGIEKIQITTVHPKLLARYGFHASGAVVMDLNLRSEN
jgi:hypothetical protein